MVDRDRFMGGVERLQAYSAQVRSESAGPIAAESSMVLASAV
jgi:hypothetical protein